MHDTSCTPLLVHAMSPALQVTYLDTWFVAAATDCSSYADLVVSAAYRDWPWVVACLQVFGV